MSMDGIPINPSKVHGLSQMGFHLESTLQAVEFGVVVAVGVPGSGGTRATEKSVTREITLI